MTQNFQRIHVPQLISAYCYYIFSQHVLIVHLIYTKKNRGINGQGNLDSNHVFMAQTVKFEFLTATIESACFQASDLVVLFPQDVKSFRDYSIL